ncbi:MAG: hypothetical protein JST30_10520 [Armatimonadetes bacterium]|nr:hypothetical protein [Armatimonadota bacterium]
MSATWRALAGAVLGALLVLALHPRSRPYLFAGVLRRGDAELQVVRNAVAQVQGDGARPLRLTEAGLWMERGAAASERSDTNRLLLLSEIADQGARAEPDNAFWRQMKSIFLYDLAKRDGRPVDSSLREWQRAAGSRRWDDHQSERLRQLVDTLALKDGADFAWHYALAASLRSPTAAERTVLHSRAMLVNAREPKEARADDVRNGSLIRSGARSLAGAYCGVQITRFAAIGSVVGMESPRTVEEAKGAFLDLFVDRPDVQREMASQIALNEAWAALVPSRDDAAGSTGALMRGAATTVNLPGILLMVGLGGLVTALAAHLVERKPGLVRFLNTDWALFTGAAVAMLTYIVTGLVVVALWSFVAIVAFRIHPYRFRPGDPRGLGVVFGGTIAFLAVFVTLALASYLVYTSVPGTLLGQAASIPSVDGPAGRQPLYLAMLGLSLVVVAAPAWGFFYMFPATKVLPIAVKTFGSVVAVGCLGLAVLATPLCIVVDKGLAQGLSQILENEPSYHLAQPQ